MVLGFLPINPAFRRGLFFERTFCGSGGYRNVQGHFTYNHQVNEVC